MERRKKGENLQEGYILGFRERVSSFSLSFCEIRPSTAFGTRRKAALRGKGFAWVPDLRSFLKLLEVGVSPYLGFILCLRTMLVFELVEVVRGRLIGPKTVFPVSLLPIQERGIELLVREGPRVAAIRARDR